MYMGGSADFDGAMDAWWSEHTDYNYGQSAASHTDVVIGHYTQVSCLYVFV